MDRYERILIILVVLMMLYMYATVFVVGYLVGINRAHAAELTPGAYTAVFDTIIDDKDLRVDYIMTVDAAAVSLSFIQSYTTLCDGLRLADTLRCDVRVESRRAVVWFGEVSRPYNSVFDGYRFRPPIGFDPRRFCMVTSRIYPGGILFRPAEVPAGPPVSRIYRPSSRSALTISSGRARVGSCLLNGAVGAEFR